MVPNEMESITKKYGPLEHPLAYAMVRLEPHSDLTNRTTPLLRFRPPDDGFTIIWSDHQLVFINWFEVKSFSATVRKSVVFVTSRIWVKTCSF